MAMIPPFFLNAVVAIGTTDPQGARAWVATGFFYGAYERTTPEGQDQYSVYLVTNKHVAIGLREAFIRVNPTAAQAATEVGADFVGSDGKQKWYGHPDSDVDVAVLPVNFNWAKESGYDVAFFASNNHAANIAKLQELGITEGDFL